MHSGHLTKQRGWGAVSLCCRDNRGHTWAGDAFVDLNLSVLSPLIYLFICLCILPINKVCSADRKAQGLFPSATPLTVTHSLRVCSYTGTAPLNPVCSNVHPVERCQTREMKGRIRAGSRSCANRKSKEGGLEEHWNGEESLLIIRNPRWALPLNQSLSPAGKCTHCQLNAQKLFCQVPFFRTALGLRERFTLSAQPCMFSQLGWLQLMFYGPAS